MQLHLTQDGAEVGNIDLSSPDFSPANTQARYGGYVLKSTRRIGGETTANIDPTKPVEYRLDIATHASALGTAQAYIGVPYYRLAFSTPGTTSVPLVVERRDPTDEPANPTSLLYGTVGTPELVDGNVQQVDSIGPYAATAGEKLVTFANSTPSGFTMPVSLVDGDGSLQLRIASLVSAETNLDKVGVQIGYTTGSEFNSLFADTLSNLFSSYSDDSGLPEMPFWSPYTSLNLDIGGVPRGDLMFLFAFGDLEASGLVSTLVMDSFSVVPEPAAATLLALASLGVMACRRREPQRGT